MTKYDMALAMAEVFSLPAAHISGTVDIHQLCLWVYSLSLGHKFLYELSEVPSVARVPSSISASSNNPSA